MTNDENGNPENVEATMPTDWMQQTFPAIRLACAAKEGEAHSSASMLQELFARMSDHQKFEVGQIVTWKPGLKNRKDPDYGQHHSRTPRNILPDRPISGSLSLWSSGSAMTAIISNSTSTAAVSLQSPIRRRLALTINHGNAPRVIKMAAKSGGPSGVRM